MAAVDPARAASLAARFAAGAFACRLNDTAEHGLAGGAVTAVHRSDRAGARATIHLLTLDGVYATGASDRVFRPHDRPPSTSQLEALVQRLALGPGVRVDQRPTTGPPISAADRQGRRDVVRLLARAPTADHGEPVGTRLRHRLVHPFSDGTTHVELDVADVARHLRRLVPHVGPVAYHGVLAAPALARWRVVAGAPPSAPAACARCPGVARLVRLEESAVEPAESAAQPAAATG